jgi:uncharacterized protein (DUF488 family)
MEIYSIGFTKKSAAEFFGALRSAGVARLIDVRLHNTSHLAGFAKQDDLRFFLQEINKIEYVHLPLLAPSDALFDTFKKKKGSWDVFRKGFLELMAERRIETELDPRLFREPAILLCSEPAPAHCHRSLIIEYLNQKWGGIKAVHL